MRSRAIAEVAGLGGGRIADPILPLDRVPGPEARGAPQARIAAQLRRSSRRRRGSPAAFGVRERCVVARCRHDASTVGRDDPRAQGRHVADNVSAAGATSAGSGAPPGHAGGSRSAPAVVENRDRLLLRRALR